MAKVKAKKPEWIYALIGETGRPAIAWHSVSFSEEAPALKACNALNTLLRMFGMHSEQEADSIPENQLEKALFAIGLLDKIQMRWQRPGSRYSLIRYGLLHARAAKMLPPGVK